MVQADLTKYQPYIIIGFIVAFSLFSLWIRGLPAEVLVTPQGVDLMGNDPWYNLRQVEQVVAHFPGYAWFDAMTLYPGGDVIYWGPLFIYIISALSILVGATTRPEIMVVASWVPPLMAAAMVPIVYLLAAKISDWKTGIIAAGFVSVVSGQYVYRSLFSFVDHHIAETLFSTLFVLVYVLALISARDYKVDFKRFETLKIPGVMAVFAGFAYLLGLYTMPTMVLFALIVAVFTVIQFIWDFYVGRSSEYLVLLNAVVFAVAIIGTAATGFPHPGFDLSRYTIGHVVVYGVLIAGTMILYGLSVYLKGRPKSYYPLSLAGIGVIGIAAIFVAAPDIYSLLISSLISFFGTQAVTVTVQEARPWSFDAAWNTFHLGLLMMIGGIAALIWRNRDEENAAQIFVVVWSLVILASTIAHVRYEYYMGVNVALLSAIFVGAVLNFGWKDIRLLAGSAQSGNPSSEPAAAREEPVKKGKKGPKSAGAQKPKSSSKNQPDYLKVGAFVGIALVAVIFAGVSMQNNFGLVGLAEYSGMNSQWKESLQWMGANTPDTGVDYYAIHDKNTFTYPEESYGVMSWWDYGHWITFVAKRIPNSNPFQHGVAGPEGSAAYFTATSEEAANRILDTLGTRYVITDIEMDTGKFWAMATWADPIAGRDPFEPTFLVQTSTSSQSYQSVPFYSQQYYMTMVSRLHNFDGSMTDPSSQVYYVEYRDSAAANTSLPVVTKAEQMNATAAQTAAETYNRNAPAGSHATVLNLYYQVRGDAITQPVDRVPALQHYRLVYESPQNVFRTSGTGGPDVKYVKIFEYVSGARIKGEGTIEVPIVTNTGREFIYRQESVDGEFIVPYATSGWPGDVKAAGQYRITGTDRTFDVTEEDIQQGRTIN
jgi:dolichyl-phosphooligosaccharide-protein glycotransferase